MKLPKITTKQEEILRLLYRYRFANRVQLQALLGHSDKRRVIAWLKDLREKEYVGWIYSTDFIEKTKPAVYFISSNGIRFLKADGSYPLAAVRKRYKDRQRSRTFVDHSVCIAACCIGLEVLPTSTERSAAYRCITEADYGDPDHAYHFLAEHEKLRPNICIVKQTSQATTHHLLEIFDASLPQYRLRNRLKAYVTYLSDNEWEGAAPLPIILLVVSTLTDLIYAKRCTRKLLLDAYYEVEEIDPAVHIRFTTTEKLTASGIDGMIWEELYSRGLQRL